MEGRRAALQRPLCGGREQEPSNAARGRDVAQAGGPALSLELAGLVGSAALESSRNYGEAKKRTLNEKDQDWPDLRIRKLHLMKPRGVLGDWPAWNLQTDRPVQSLKAWHGEALVEPESQALWSETPPTPRLFTACEPKLFQTHSLHRSRGQKLWKTLKQRLQGWLGFRT